MQKDPAEAKPLSRSEKDPSRQRTKPQKPNAIKPAASQTPPQKQQIVHDRRTKRKRHLSRQSFASIPSRNRCAFEVTLPQKPDSGVAPPPKRHSSTCTVTPSSSLTAKGAQPQHAVQRQTFHGAAKPNTAANRKTPTQSSPAATHSKEQQRIHRAWTVVDSLTAAETVARNPR